MEPFKGGYAATVSCSSVLISQGCSPLEPELTVLLRCSALCLHYTPTCVSIPLSTGRCSCDGLRTFTHLGCDHLFRAGGPPGQGVLQDVPVPSLSLGSELSLRKLTLPWPQQILRTIVHLGSLLGFYVAIPSQVTVPYRLQ